MSEKVAIVGATGAVGREFLDVLESRDFPLSDLRLLASKRSAGRRLSFRGGQIAVEELRPGALDGVGIAFFSAGSSISRAHARPAASAGTIVIDNSSAFRMEEDVPLVVPEINGSEAPQHHGIIANPNCSTIIFVMALQPIWAISRVKRAIVCTYQAVSGAGAGGIEALRRETSGGAGPAGEEGDVFPHPIGFNILPEVGGFLESGESEEEVKMERETRKIIGDPEIRISSTCVRVPVYRAHSEAVHLETERSLSLDEIRDALGRAPGVEVRDDPSSHLYPMPVEASGQDKVLVGRIRRIDALENGIALFLSGDQLLKGAALNAVQIAELLL